jgi:hypothetical protein
MIKFIHLFIKNLLCWRESLTWKMKMKNWTKYQDLRLGAWRDGPMGKSAWCSFKEPRFNSRHSHGSSNTLISSARSSDAPFWSLGHQAQTKIHVDITTAYDDNKVGDDLAEFFRGFSWVGQDRAGLHWDPSFIRAGPWLGGSWRRPTLLCLRTVFAITFSSQSSSSMVFSLSVSMQVHFGILIPLSAQWLLDRSWVCWAVYYIQNQTKPNQTKPTKHRMWGLSMTSLLSETQPGSWDTFPHSRAFSPSSYNGWSVCGLPPVSCVQSKLPREWWHSLCAWVWLCTPGNRRAQVGACLAAASLVWPSAWRPAYKAIHTH